MPLRHKQIDKLGKNLLRYAPRALLTAMGLRIGRRKVAWEDVAINVPEHQADGVLVIGAPDDPTRYALLVEFETRPKARNRKEWFYKTGALAEQLQCRVFLIVVYIRRGSYASFPSVYEIAEDGLTQTFGFNTLRLWELSDEIRNGALRALAPTLLVSEGPADVQRLSEVRKLIEEGGFSRTERNNLLAIAATIATLMLNETEIQKAMATELRLLRRSPIFRQWLDESEARGVEQGIEQGVEIGEVREARNSLLRVLAVRFGPVPDRLVHQIEAADLEWCRVTRDRALVAASLAELNLAG